MSLEQSDSSTWTLTHSITQFFQCQEYRLSNSSFFNRKVLAKYDADPHYAIRYASPTYESILENEFTLPFGISRHGHLILWLGDIAKLPKPEQYYLLSENRESDHSLGSEFYDGQIECIFTEPSQETLLFAARSNFLVAAFNRWSAQQKFVFVIAFA